MKQKKQSANTNKFDNCSDTHSHNKQSINLNELATNQQRFPHEDQRERRDGPGGN